MQIFKQKSYIKMHFLTKIVTFKHFICVYQLNFVTLQSI